MINLTSMLTASDIRDWIFVEALGLGTYRYGTHDIPTKEQLGKLFEASPVAHVSSARAPTLVLLGLKDRRVPPTQGVEWHHTLKGRGVVTRMLAYPDDVHALDKPATECDAWINIAQWFGQHLGVEYA